MGVGVGVGVVVGVGVGADVTATLSLVHSSTAVQPYRFSPGRTDVRKNSWPTLQCAGNCDPTLRGVVAPKCEKSITCPITHCVTRLAITKARKIEKVKTTRAPVRTTCFLRCMPTISTKLDERAAATPSRGSSHERTQELTRFGLD